MQLIDADALTKKIQFLIRTHHRDAFDALNEIDNAPTIDPECLRPQGEWIDIYGGKYANPRYACSACGEKALYKFEVDALGHEKAVQALSDSCPKCGAKMKGAGYERTFYYPCHTDCRL